MRFLFLAATLCLELVPTVSGGSGYKNSYTGEVFVWDDKYKVWETVVFPKEALGMVSYHGEGARIFGKVRFSSDGAPLLDMTDGMEQDFSFDESVGLGDIGKKFMRDRTCRSHQKDHELFDSTPATSATTFAKLGEQRDHYVDMFQQTPPCKVCELHLDAARELCLTLARLGRTHDTIKLLNLIVDFKIDLFGPDHLSTLESKSLLARHYHNVGYGYRGHGANTEGLLDQVVTGLTDLCGAQDTRTLQARLDQALQVRKNQRHLMRSSSDATFFHIWRDARDGDASSREVAVKAAICLGLSYRHQPERETNSWNEAEYWLQLAYSKLNTTQDPSQEDKTWISDVLFTYFLHRGRLVEAEPFLHARIDRLRRMGYRPNVDMVRQTLKRMNDDHDAEDAAILAALKAPGEEIEEDLQTRVDANLRGSSGTTLFVEACVKGHDRLVSLLLKHGSSIGDTGSYYGTALNAAALLGHERVVSMLLDAGADVNLAAGTPRTAIQAATYGGHLSIVKTLLKRGANVNLEGGALGTPLQAAAFHGDISIVRLLLENGADPNVESGHFGNALQAAAHMAHEEIVRELLRHGAKMQIGQGQFSSAVHAAVARNNIAVFEILLQHSKADVLACNHSLSAAAAYGHLQIFHALIDAGAELDQETDAYGCPIVAAVQGQQEDTLQYLIAHGADLNHQCKLGDGLSTPLEAAVLIGHASTVQALLENGASLDTSSTSEPCPFIAPSRDGNEAVVELLLNHGADPDFFGCQSQTALHTASRMGHLGIVSLLLDHGADPSIVLARETVCTALHTALNSYDDKIAEMLLKAGAGTEISCEESGTALHMAITHHRQRIIKIILAQHGTDPYAKTSKGNSPLQMAIDSMDPSTVDLLISEGVGFAESRIRSLDSLVHLSASYKRVLSLDSESDHGTDGSSNIDKRRILEEREQLIRSIRDSVEAGADIDGTKNPDRTSALEAASIAADCDLIQPLLDLGADVNLRSERGLTPMMALLSAMSWHFSSIFESPPSNADHIRVLDILLDAGANVHDRTNTGKSALHLASESGILAVVKWAVEHGVDVNGLDSDHATALHMAAFHGHKHVVDYLLKAGADINLQGRKHGTALLAAARAPVIWLRGIGNEEAGLQEYEACVDLLLEAGADPNLLFREEEDEEDSAASGDVTYGMRYQGPVDSDLFIHWRNQKELLHPTAIRAAASRGYASMVRLLLEHGADVGDALQAAEEAGHAEVAELIKSHQAATRCMSPMHDDACSASGN